MVLAINGITWSEFLGYGVTTSPNGSFVFARTAVVRGIFVRVQRMNEGSRFGVISGLVNKYAACGSVVAELSGMVLLW